MGAPAFPNPILKTHKWIELHYVVVPVIVSDPTVWPDRKTASPWFCTGVPVEFWEKKKLHLKNRIHSSRLHRMVISHQKHTRGWCKTPTTSNTVWCKICYSCVISTSLGWTTAERSRHTSLQLVEAQSQTVLSPPPPPLTCKSNLIWQTFTDKAAWKNTHTHTHTRIQWPSLQQSWITISKCVHKKQDNH